MQVIENERSLIGGLLLQPEKLADIFDVVSIRDFVSENAAISYGAMLSLWKDQEPITIDTIVHKVGSDKIKWLVDCSDVGSPATLVFNALLVSKEAQKRRIATKLDVISKDTKFIQPEEMLSEVLSVYNSESVFEKKDPVAHAVVQRFKDSIKENRDRGYVGLPTGFKFFSSKLIEYVKGHLWMIGAYTATGKTALMVEMLSRLFESQDPIVEIISTEMTDQQLTARMVSNITGFSANGIWSGKLIPKHAKLAYDTLGMLSTKKYRLHDNVKTVGKVEAIVRKRFLQGGVDIVFLDFIQNLRKPECRTKYEESSQIAIDLQHLAKSCECTIVCLSQITSTVHKSNADIVEYKGAGELAESCDLGLWLKRSSEDNRKMLLEIRKNRHGMLGKQVLMYDEYFTGISEHDDTENQ